jgi:transcriptional regulator with XRE-family HTH domain
MKRAPDSALEAARRIGELARAAREARGLSIRSAAGEFGISPRFLHQLEHGKPTARMDKVHHALERLGLELSVKPAAGTTPRRSATHLEALIAHRVADRRRRALAGARRVLRMLARSGIEAGVIGSLARGTFGAHSDVDFLVVECPRKLKYAIEGRVEDEMDGIGFDAVYLDELDEHFRKKALDEVRYASDLR